MLQSIQVLCKQEIFMIKRSCVILLLSGCMWYEPSYKIGRRIEDTHDLCSMNYSQVLRKLGPPSFESEEGGIGHTLHYYAQEVRRGRTKQEQYIKILFDENEQVSQVVIKGVE